MKREQFKKIRQEALEKSKNNSTIENMLLISELLQLESDILKEEKKDVLSFKLMKLSFEISNLISDLL